MSWVHSSIYNSMHFKKLFFEIISKCKWIPGRKKL